MVKRATIKLFKKYFATGIDAKTFLYAQKDRFIFYSIFFAVGIINAILTTFLNNALHGTWYDIFTILVLVWGAVICMWLIDLFKIVINKFKIPVSRS